MPVSSFSRLQRLSYRCWHCGLRELDVLMGRFADARLRTMTAHEIAIFEALLDAESPDLLDWLTGAQPVPEAHRSPVMDELRKFCVKKR